MAAAKQQVIMAVDMAPFLLLISSFRLDLLGVSEAVIFMGFTLPHKELLGCTFYNQFVTFADY